MFRGEIMVKTSQAHSMLNPIILHICFMVKPVKIGIKTVNTEFLRVFSPVASCVAESWWDMGWASQVKRYVSAMEFVTELVNLLLAM